MRKLKVGAACSQVVRVCLYGDNIGFDHSGIKNSLTQIPIFTNLTFL